MLYTLFLENHSIFSDETLHSCSWYNIGGQYAQTIPRYAGGYFGVFWGPILAYVLFSLISIWHNSDYH